MVHFVFTTDPPILEFLELIKLAMVLMYSFSIEPIISNLLSLQYTKVPNLIFDRKIVSMPYIALLLMNPIWERYETSIKTLSRSELKYQMSSFRMWEKIMTILCSLYNILYICLVAFIHADTTNYISQCWFDVLQY